MEKQKRLRLIPDYGDPNDPAVRAKYGYLEGIVSIVGNVILFVIKLFLGVFINSIALIADSVHTLSDVGTSVVVIVSFHISKKPSDTIHPYGYGRVEYIATVVIAVLLIITGFGFIQQSVERILNSVNITHQQYTLLIGIIVILSALLKEWMARFSLALGKKINSDVLTADAWHHRSDAFASLGVGLSIIGSSYGYPLLDPIFGIVVSVIIIYVGFTLGKTSAHHLIGQSPDTDLIDRVQEIGHHIKGVKNIHDISVHDYGAKKIITFHTEVDKDLPLDHAHEIADALEKKIAEAIHYSTIIHMEPTSYHRETMTQKKIIENILDRQKGVISFHNLRVIRRSDRDDISVHLIVNKKMRVQESHELSHRIETIIQKTYGSCNVHIHLEPCERTDCPFCMTPCDEKNQT